MPYGEGTLLVSFVNLLEISPKYSIINLVCREPAAWLLVAWLHSVEPLVLSLPINLQKTALVSLTESYVLKVMYSLNLLSVPLGIYYCFFPFFFFFYKLWLVYVISVDCFPTMKPPQDYLGRPKGKQQWFISRLDEGSFKMWAQGKRMLLLKWTDGISWRSMPAQCSDLGNAIFYLCIFKKSWFYFSIPAERAYLDNDVSVKFYTDDQGGSATVTTTTGHTFNSIWWLPSTHRSKVLRQFAGLTRS